jgi:hypothetical protein
MEAKAVARRASDSTGASACAGYLLKRLPETGIQRVVACGMSLALSEKLSLLTRNFRLYAPH